MFRFCNIHGGGEAVGGVLVDEEKEVDEVDELVDEEMTKGAIHHDKPAALGGGSPGQHGWFLQNKPALIDEGDGEHDDDDDADDDFDADAADYVDVDDYDEQKIMIVESLDGGCPSSMGGFFKASPHLLMRGLVSMIMMVVVEMMMTMNS